VPTIRIAPGDVPDRFSVVVPGSKSITNRAVLLAGVAHGTSEIVAPLVSDDTLDMLGAVRALGAEVTRAEDDATWTIGGIGGPPATAPAATTDVWCGMAGTVARFLLPMCAAGRGRFALDADAQLRGRPIGQLTAALERQGVRFDPPGPTHLPVTLEAAGLPGGPTEVDTSVSSQFVSGLLMSAPFAREAARFSVGEAVSRPYIDMTVDVMRRFGATVDAASAAATDLAVARGAYRATRFVVEPDASTASYFLAAAAVTGSQVAIDHLDPATSTQGDIRLVQLLGEMGCVATPAATGVALRGPRRLRGIVADMTDCTDVFMTLACVAVFADGPTTITGIATTRVKESDRVSAVAENLARLGIATDVGDDHITIHPGTPVSARLPTFRDHRIAMAFSVIGLRTPVEIEDPAVVRKTCPSFYELWPATGARATMLADPPAR
jgi:3-phosphoshikimate 1-carboxyvinyltransferase